MTKPPAAAPLAADRCKAPEWCGVELDTGDPRAVIYLDASDKHYTKNMPQRGMPPASRKGYRFCSPACRDARLPPLAAQPAETPGLVCGTQVGPGLFCAVRADECVEHRKPAPQPAPTCAHGCSDVQANTACPTHGKPKPAKPACACRWGNAICSGDVAVRNVGCFVEPCCVGCMMVAENAFGYARTATGILRDPAIPERLERPKLAHSSMWADEAEDAS